MNSSTSTLGSDRRLIEGQYFDGRSSTPVAAQIYFTGDRVVHVVGLAAPREASLDAVVVSDRIGHTPRRLRFADDAAFETFDNDAVDVALAALNERSFSGAVNRWESHWRVAVGALLIVVVFSVLFVRYGIPLLANAAAHVLPASVDRAIGNQGLLILDKSFMEPSALSPVRQAELRRRFDAMTAPLDDGHRYRLELRKGNSVGANAFALPDGTVVMTDELVALARNDDEIIAVLAHEVGHVRHRHALRMILQSAGVAVITLAIFGDVSSTSGLAAALPTVLLNAKHSREFEHEADGFAKEWLRAHDIPERRFDDLLCRLAQKSPSDPDFRYLSSHPPTNERANCTPASAQ